MTPTQESPALSQSTFEKSINSTTLNESAIETSFPSRSLWIGNLDANQSVEELGVIFSKFGSIESIRMLPGKECAFINYVSLENALEAKEQMQSSRIGNCIVRIGYGKSESIDENKGLQPTKSLCKQFF